VVLYGFLFQKKLGDSKNTNTFPHGWAKWEFTEEKEYELSQFLSQNFLMMRKISENPVRLFFSFIDVDYLS